VCVSPGLDFFNKGCSYSLEKNSALALKNQVCEITDQHHTGVSPTTGWDEIPNPVGIETSKIMCGRV
jgi:hypothetical protein